MEKKEVLLAQMKEVKSRYGNLYFFGVTDTGNKIVMRKVKKKKKGRCEQQVWELFISG